MPNDIIITPVSASIQFSGSAYASIKLTVDASGSLLVSGNSGSLFSITDNLSGSLMSVNTIAGLPIMEVFSDNRVNIGKYASEAIKVQSGGSDVAFGSGSVMFVTSSGRVGIGVNTPLNKLDVAGNISCSAITASFFGTSSWSTNSLTASSLISGNSYNITNLTASNISASRTGSFGMVGIGTTSPSRILQSGTSFGVASDGVVNWGSNIDTPTLAGILSWDTGRVMIGTKTVSVDVSFITSGNVDRMRITSGGNVGIGTTSPGALLDVSGSSRHGYRSADTHQFTGSVSISGSLNATSSWSTNALTASSLVSANSYNITNLTSSNISASGTGSFGRVGIGTATPSQKLTVSGTGTVVGRIESTSNGGARDAQLQLYVNNSGGADPAGSILFNASSSGGEISYGKIVVTNTVLAAAGNGEMQFWTSLSGTATERMRINKDGSVGIGTTNPAYLLDVSGSSRHGYRSSDTHQFTGSVSISGSLNATSSWSTNALTASSLVVGNSYNITNLTASNISASGTGSFGIVGIGSVSPGYKLDVNGTAQVDVLRIGYSTNQGTITYGGGLGMIVKSTSSQPLSLGAGGRNSDITINQTTGNVSIGLTSSVNRLDVAGNISCSVITASLFNGTSSWSTNALTASGLVVGNSYTITNLTASNISASGTSSFGRVGIGTLNPSGSLDVSGSIYTSAKLVQRSTTQSLSGSASCSIDLANGAVHILSLSSSAVISGLTYGNRDNNPHVNTIMLVLKYNGAATVTFTDVIWANAVTPSITAASGYADVFMLTSYKGGAVTPVWIGTVVSQALVSTNL